ncbi:fumarylacetoacetate hydrolase family protein [Streptomyces sp. SID13031]|uniref:fumarylacetoacetate hydrolase family protein n=1 Tax=Streptomyces sp. SID13031 TaxID=2706046 RepID=UPI0013C5AAB0|nr:fumarylacetoacetate hydrolase family protein [Streptomyces sp. SID13031]NEA30721.1 fumarylacetoacetate hydrolase family protein [Streptomyces sp. SID13031]
MRFATFTPARGTAARIGLIVDDGETVVDIEAALRGELDVPGDLRSLIEAGPAVLDSIRVAVHGQTAWPPGTAHRLAEVRLHAPLRPGKVIGVGLNYVEHVEESSRTLDTDEALPARPVLFSKPATAVVGPGEPIRHDPGLTEQLDWECELAVVIGRTARSVDRDDAYAYVFGYTILNDISARDQRRAGQWFFSKGQDSYAPLGPIVVTADELPDPHSLQLSLFVNGEQKQDGNSKHMLFGIPELIEDITSGITLEPGDVIATGSPQGVGAAQDPPQYLRPGDVVEARIEGIGALTNPVEAV